jgi:hypothetical protein
MSAFRLPLRAALPVSAALYALPASRRRREAQCESAASWEVLQAYAEDQRREVAAGRGPRRDQTIDERYRRYFSWAKGRGHTGAEYITLTAKWCCEHGGPWVALEPNIVPYDMDPGIEHWNLWYHPSTTAGTADLDMQVGAKVEIRNGADTRKGTVRSVRGWAADSTCIVAVTTDDGEVVTVPRSEIRPQGWAAVLQHVRIFLPKLQDEEVVIFQNIPELRSVPEVAHAHVFIRASSSTTQAALRRLRHDWQMRSPWAEAERLGGRGCEVGFEE